MNYELTEKGVQQAYWPFTNQQDWDRSRSWLKSPSLKARRSAIEELVAACQQREKEAKNAA